MKGKAYRLAVFAASGLLFSFQASAFGLGKLEASSALNEPFMGEIQVISLREGEFDNIAVGLASSEEFNKAGIERPFLLSKLKFDVVEKDNGTVVIEIKSKQPIKEPFLDFLLVVSTGQNKMLREYTVLLDPPTAVLPRAEPKKIAPSPKPVAPTPAKVAPAAVKTTSYQYEDASSSEMVSSYGPTDKYDTLWKLSSKVRTDKSVSVNQIMMAILNDNPAAFHRNNINGLKVGQTLSIPSVDDIKALSRSQAVAAVREQNRTWQRGKKKPVAAKVDKKEAPVTTVATNTDASPETVTDTTKQSDGKSVADSTASTSQLKLVAPSDELIDPDNIESNASGSESIDKLSEQLTLAQETIAGQTQDNIDFKARMDALEEQINTLHRLIEIKDADLARLQSNLEDDSSPAVLDEAMQTNEEALLREQLATLEEESALVTPDDKAEQSEPELAPASDIVDYVKPTPKVTLPPVEVSILDNKNSILEMVSQALSESKTQKLLGGVLILLILWLALRTRSKTEESWQEAAMGGGTAMRTEPEEAEIEVPAGTSDNNDGDVPIGEPTRSYVEDTGVLTVEDLVAEADAYTTYDNYPRAEVLLEKARTVEPENIDVGWKLLHVLFKQSRVEEFSALAQELKATIKEENPEKWSEICEWGSQIDPEHNLFKSMENSSVANESMEVESTLPEAIDDVTIDTTDDDLEFDLGKFSLDAESTTDDDTQDVVESIDLETVTDDEALSFDAPLELTTETDIEDTETEELTVSVDQAPQLDESLQVPESTADETEYRVDDIGDYNEVETKLDLAVAFVEMGDPDGANTILEEILQQGNEDQKARAQSLLDTDNAAIGINDTEDDVEEVSEDFSIEEIDIDTIDEAETKLDLAVAYIDIDDTDGAKTVLKEIINEGDDEQKKRAQDLLDKL